MKTPLIHPISSKKIDLILRDLPQALLVTGPEGVGLSTIAKYKSEAKRS